MKKLLTLVLVALLGWAFYSYSSNGFEMKPVEAGGVTVYYKNDFEQGKKGFSGSKKVEQKLIQTHDSGQALQTVSKEKWAGPGLDLDIQGSQELKIAFLAKGQNFPRARLNVYDQKAEDNTTAYAYRHLSNDTWTPVVYHLDRFRYNSKNRGYVAEDTHYKGVRFFGPEPGQQEVSLSLDNFAVYRGQDTEPPKQVTGLEAEADANGVMLQWQEAEDNVLPMLYVIARAKDGGQFEKIAESHQSAFLDQTAGQGSYEYKVLACDFENNLGPWSSRVQVQSQSQAKEQEPGRLEQDRQGYAQKVREVHEQGQGNVNQGHVALFGDSLTHASTYRHEAAAALGIYTVQAHGYQGKKTGFGLQKAEQILEKENPEFLLILFGTNNVRGSMQDRSKMEDWMQDLQGIVRKAESRGTVAVLGTIPPRGFNDPQSKPEAAFNELLLEKARQWQVPVAYIFQAIQDAGPRKEYLAGDGVHWSSKGMQVAGQAWAETMRQVEFALRYR